MTISHYIVWFALFSFFGWIFECVLNAIREGVWENRGFLYGPICPIYGLGVVLYMLAFDNELVATGAIPLWGVFLIAMLGSAVLEYLTSVTMERAFGARWWDYSNTPLNINGRICLPASLLFGAGGLGTVVVLIPLAHATAGLAPIPVWEAAAFAIVIAASVDTTLSLTALTELLEKVEQASEKFDQAMSGGIQNAQDRARSASDAISSGATEARMQFKLFNMLTFGRMTSMIPARQQRIPEPVQNFVSTLTERQKRALSSIKGYPSRKSTAFGEAARQAIHKANLKLSLNKKDHDNTGAQNDSGASKDAGRHE
ncbi:MAG: putative ABC transporter permease [Coriobacteriia bacterium]|nr:putative ABC transporter permease [Coriobacteriia bacterium]